MKAYNFNRPLYRPWVGLMRAALLFAILFICFGSLKSGVQTALSTSDKVLHFLAYGILTGLIAAAFPRLKLIHVFLCACAFGMLMEGLQFFLTTYREASIGDQIANMTGSVGALFIWMVWVIVLASLRLGVQKNSA